MSEKSAMTISQITFFYTLTYTDYIFRKCLNLKFFSGFLFVGVNIRLIWVNALVQRNDDGGWDGMGEDY